MLPKPNRLNRSGEIKLVVRTGFAVRTPTVIAHILADHGPGIRFCFIAGKRLGGATTRNRAKRRFREMTKDLVSVPAAGQRPPEICVVWRLQPGAVGASADAMRRDIERVWRKAAYRAGSAAMGSVR